MVAAHPLAQGQPILVGQHQVEQHHVEALARQGGTHAPTVAHGLGHEAEGCQVVEQQGADGGIVVHQQASDHAEILGQW